MESKLSYSLNFFKKWGVILFFINTAFSQIDLQINLLNTAQYTLSNFNDTTIEQWTVLVTNNYPFERKINLELILNYNDIQPAVWGLTKTIELGAVGNNNTKLLRNSEFLGSDMRNYIQDDEFINMIETLGYLPAGDFQLIIKAYFELDDNEINSSSYEISAPPVALREINVSNTVTSEIILIEPTNISDISETYPWFKWDSPGFANGVNIDYRLQVYQYNPEISSSPADALSNDNQLYFDSNWGNIVVENGNPQLISLQYPSDDRDLACGYEYVWRVESREIIESMDSQGVWGWPEPVTSPTFSFTYGNTISSDNILSPIIGAEVNSVRPTFNFDAVFCAESYEIWLSNSEDVDIDNPIWKSESIQSTSIQYPSDGIGLVPGNIYYWKIRINPDGDPGPWSEIFVFNIPSINLSDPLDAEYINTVHPTFNISYPLDIASFQLRIGDSDDPDVTQANIFSDYITTFPYVFPDDAPNALLPYETYFWSVIAYDEGGNMVGEIEDYSTSSFSINSISLIQPSDGLLDISLTPNFTWESPIGVANFIFLLSNYDDPQIESPFFSTVVNGTYFQYSQFADIPLQYNETYYWSIIPIDNNDNSGLLAAPFSFTTINQGTEADEFVTLKPEFSLMLVNELDKAIKVNIIEAVSGADEYLVQISNNQSMDDIINEISLSQYEMDTIFADDIIQWGTSYYIQIIAQFEGDIIGEASNIYMITTPSKPGSEDQIVFSIDNSESLLNPKIQITNIVTNAIEYIFTISLETDMSDIFYEVNIEESATFLYSSDAPQLLFGETYYLQVHALDEEGPHGIPSSILSLYIPSIVPPNLSDILFNWEVTSPVANKYQIEISLTEDFSNIIFSDIIEDNSYEYNAINFSQATSYYWRVQGLDSDGLNFGNVSSIGYFLTESIEEEIVVEEESQDEEIEEEETEQDEVDESDEGDIDQDEPEEDVEIEEETEEEEVPQIIIELQQPLNNSIVNSQQPIFKWVDVEAAEKYEIIVCTDLELTDVTWGSSNIILNEVKYPSLGSTPLLFNQSYYWSVRALSDNNILGEFASPLSFSITSDFIPILEGPLNETASSLLPYFTWNQIQFAEKYEIILGTNEDLSHIIFSNSNISDHLFQFPSEPPLNSNTIYFWKISAYDSNGDMLGDYSNIGSFTTPSGIIEIEFIYGNNP